MKNNQLNRYLNRFGALALSFGCAVGWGSFVMPGTTFLPVAGPLGTALGIIIGALIMVVIGMNYHYMMNRFEDGGGAYTYTKKIFGFDHGFLNAWFLILTYIAVLWANSTALVLIFRNLLGTSLQFGFHYTIANYEIYFGELLLPLGAFILIGLLCMYRSKVAMWVQIVLASILFLGIIVVFIAAVAKNGFVNLTPLFADSDKNGFVQIISIVVLAPWAFVGFESISHSTSEFKFKTKNTIWIIIVAIVAAAIAYVLLSEIAIVSIPDGYTSWNAYLNDLGNLSGIEGLPTFNSAKAALGVVGLVILGLAALSGILTGVIGNYIASSRLLYFMSKDELLPSWFGRTNKYDSPHNAILVVMLLSLPIPFLGRTAVAWIVDVTTIGAIVIYAYISACTMRMARKDRKTPFYITGLLGILFSTFFGAYFLLPALFGTSLATESYLILVIWCIVGLLFFLLLFMRDKKKQLGNTTFVFAMLFVMVLLISLVWMKQTAEESTLHAIAVLKDRLQHALTEEEINFLKAQINALDNNLWVSSLVQIALVGLALIIIFGIFYVSRKREREMEIEKIHAEESSKAKSDFLSNVSHDIRTPMNAIVGYITLIKKEENIPPIVLDYLTKIDNSSHHLLSLINDVLDMSRIESGKMELVLDEGNIIDTFIDIRDMFLTQMENKKITFDVNYESIKNKYVIFDKKALNRVLLNLVSNAYKYTPEGGKVALSIEEKEESNGLIDYEIRVKDTGIGMSEQFLTRIFDAFEREKRSTVNEIQGTGLGMSITKNFIDLMGGTISVTSELGKGSEFVIKLSLAKANHVEENVKQVEEDVDLSDIKILVVDDNMINLEIASLMLKSRGFKNIDTLDSGILTINKLKEQKEKYYDIILMDVMMPEQNGHETTRLIRQLDNKDIASTPIIAMTANVFKEDIDAAYAAGMNGFVCKPLDLEKMIKTIKEVLTDPSSQIKIDKPCS